MPLLLLPKSLSEKYCHNNDFLISAIEHGASYSNWEESFVQPNHVLPRKEKGEYLPMVSIDSFNVGDGYLWSGKPGAKSKVIDVRQLKKNVHINVYGSFDNTQKQGWYDKTISTGVDIIDMHEERKFLSAATSM